MSVVGRSQSDLGVVNGDGTIGISLIAATAYVALSVAAADVPPESLVYGDATVAINDVIAYTPATIKDGGGTGMVSVDTLGVPTVTDSGDSATIYGNHAVNYSFKAGVVTRFVVDGNIASIEALFTITTKDADGYSVLAPSATARLIYVDPNAADDTSWGIGGAGTTHYTMSTLPNPNNWENPGAVNTFKTPQAARLAVGSEDGDWVLFKRGEVFTTPTSLFCKSGVSMTLPTVYRAYGTGARPHINPTAPANCFELISSSQYIAIMGLLIYPTFRDPDHVDFVGWGTEKTGLSNGVSMFSATEDAGLLIEDCDFNYNGQNISIRSKMTDVIVRKNIIRNANVESVHSQGMWATGSSVIVEDNVFDHNGWGQPTIPWYGVASSGSSSTVTVSPSPGWDVDQFVGATINIVTDDVNKYNATVSHDGQITSNTADTVTYEDRPATGVPQADFTGGGQTFQIGRYNEARLYQANGKSHHIYNNDMTNSIYRNNNFCRGSFFAIKLTANDITAEDPTPFSSNIAIYQNVVNDEGGGIMCANNNPSAFGTRFHNVRVYDNVSINNGESQILKNLQAWVGLFEDCEGFLFANNVYAKYGSETVTQCLGINCQHYFKEAVISRNVWYDIGDPTHTYVGGNNQPIFALGFAGLFTSSADNNQVIGNYFQNQNKDGLVVGRYYSTAGWQFSGNHYYSTRASNNWFDLDDTLVNNTTFFAETGESDATLTPTTFADPERTIETYQTSLSATATKDAYALDCQARLRDREAGDPDYEAKVVQQYFKAGYTEAA